MRKIRERWHQQKAEEDFITKDEAAAAKDSNDESFDWILPEIPDQSDTNEFNITSINPKSKKKKLGKFNFGKKKDGANGFYDYFHGCFSSGHTWDKLWFHYAEISIYRETFRTCRRSGARSNH